MNKITKITTQKKSKNRYNIYIDEQFAFSVDEDTLIQESLHKGKIITEEDKLRIDLTESKQKAYTLSVHYISYRMRSCKEMYDYLYKKEVEEETIELTINRLLQEGLLDDDAFARAFIHDRIQFTTKGPEVIKKELVEKGVAPSIIDTHLKIYSFEEQLNKVIKYVEKEWKKRSKHPISKRKEQMIVALMRKGFRRDVIMEAMDESLLHEDKQIEYEKLEKQGEKIWLKFSRKYEGYELLQRTKASLYQKGFKMEMINKFLENKKESM